MPTYVYLCDVNNQEFEEFHKITEQLEECSICKKQKKPSHKPKRLIGVLTNKKHDDRSNVMLTLKSLQFLHSTTGEKLPKHLKESTLQLDLPLKKIWPQIGLENHIEDCSQANDIPNLDKTKSYRIGFSSNNISGLWDIATMSMRGVMSCMNWQSAHSKRLVGCFLDPMLGIIYITDGKQTDYGCSFVKRAVVRFVMINSKPVILVDRIYTWHPSAYIGNYLNHDEYEKNVADVFKNYIKKHLSKGYDIEVISMRDRDVADKMYGPVDSMTLRRPYWKLHIPMSEHHHILSQYETSCVDSGIAYQSEAVDKQWLDMAK